jgi:hypothetical protein
MSTAIQRDAAVVAREARRISTAADYDRLVERACQAQLILIGEASLGTQDFYQTGAALTQRLIDEHGFRAVPNGGTFDPLSATAMNGSSMQRAFPASGSICKNRRKPTRCSPKDGWSERSG